VLGPFIGGEVLAGADQPEDLTSRRLEVEVRIRHIQYRHAEVDDLLPHRLGVVGFQLQVDRLAEAVLVQSARILVEEREIEAVAQPEIVLLVACPGDLAAQDVPVEPADPVLLRPRDPHGAVVTDGYVRHGQVDTASFPNWAAAGSIRRECLVTPRSRRPENMAALAALIFSRGDCEDQAPAGGVDGGPGRRLG
jgi:hypothetical protein